MEKKYDFWFKLWCYYKAKTELYDRTLTNMRSPHDSTEAFVTGKIRGTSCSYAFDLYNKCRLIADENGKKDFKKYFKQPDNQFRFSAQGWIDMYNHLLENGELNFITEK